MKVSAAQYTASNDMQQNWQIIQQYVQQATSHNSELLLLPEVCFSLGKNTLMPSSLATNR